MGFNERRAQLIWDNVALNSTPSIGFYKEPEVAVVEKLKQKDHETIAAAPNTGVNTVGPSRRDACFEFLHSRLLHSS